MPITSSDLTDLVEHPDRLINLSAVHNFRDLGGYPTADGRQTVWRKVFRADGLYRLTNEDVAALRPLALQTVIDLRTPDELSESGTFPLDQHPVDFHHLSIIDHTWDLDEAHQFSGDQSAFLQSKYHLMLQQGGQRVGQALRILSAQESSPVVFHCAAGKDRTGVLAALLLSSLGVDDAQICADYGLTQDAMRRSIAWSKVHRPELAERYATIPKAYLAADPRAMQIILAELAQRHGSVRNYVREIGVADDTVEALGNLLLES